MNEQLFPTCAYMEMGISCLTSQYRNQSLHSNHIDKDTVHITLMFMVHKYNKKIAKCANDKYLYVREKKRGSTVALITNLDIRKTRRHQIAYKKEAYEPPLLFDDFCLPEINCSNVFCKNGKFKLQ